MGFISVCCQTGSWRKGLATIITWKRYSFQMVGLNVISYLIPKAFFATHFTNGRGSLLWRSICMFSIWNHPLTFFYHWLHLFIQFMQVRKRLLWHCNCWSWLHQSIIRYSFCFVNVWCRQWFRAHFCWLRVFWFFLILQQLIWGLPSQTLQLDLLSNSKERIQILLVNICLSQIQRWNFSMPSVPAAV